MTDDELMENFFSGETFDEHELANFVLVHVVISALPIAVVQKTKQVLNVC